MAIFLCSGKILFGFAVLTIALLFFCSCQEDVSLNSPNGLIVIIKADDLGETTSNWNRFMKIISDNEICASVGVISKNVTTVSSKTEIQRVSRLLQPNKFPIIEFWNHGYDHWQSDTKHEFQGTEYSLQLNHLELAQKFFTDSLNITSHTFSAPYNRTSIETATALRLFPEINVWMCYEKTENEYQNDWKDPNKKVINISDQHIILNVDYLYVKNFPSEKIINNYNSDRKKPYILIQIHPAAWDEESFSKFENLIRFYKDGNRAFFMTPYQFYQNLHRKSTQTI